MCKSSNGFSWAILNDRSLYFSNFAPNFLESNFINDQYDYDVLLYVANWPEVRSFAYKSLLIARAIENQSYVIWVNRVGRDGNQVYHSGDSMVIDPLGNIISQAKSGVEEVLFLELNQLDLYNLREKFKLGLDWDTFQIEP